MLGVLVEGDLLAMRSVDENIKKAMQALSLYGNIGAFWGDLSPQVHNGWKRCIFPGRIGQESSQSITAILQPRNAVSKEHNPGKEVGVPAECTGCRLKVCEWQAGK